MIKQYKSLSKIISVILAVLLALGVLPFYTFAQDDVESYLTYSVTADGITITDCDTSLSGDVVLPDTIDSLPVTVIGKQAFQSCSKITAITLPSSVKAIEMQAFSYCSTLESVTLNEGLETLETYVFESSSKLTDIHIPASLTTIPQRAFQDSSVVKFTVSADNANYTADSYGVIYSKDMTKLLQYPTANEATAYTIPEGVTDILSYAFFGSKKLTSVTIPETVINIEEQAFRSCNRLASITVPDSTETIGSYAFQGTGIESVHIGSGVKSIGDRAFDYCTKLKSATVSEANKYFFSDSNGIIYDKINGVISVLPQRLSLQVYNVPDGITEIADITLPSSLTELHIPASVTKFDKYCVADCNKLKSITVDTANNKYSSDSQGILYDEFKVNLILCPPATENTSIKVPYGVESINGSSFKSCTNLKEITIPRSVTGVGVDAFKDCTALETVNFTGTEAQWNSIKFSSGNSTLTSLDINFNVADPSEAPLEGTEGWFTYRTADGQATITDVDPSAEGELIIPSEIFGCPVIAVAENAFNGVENITNVYIPASLVTLNDIAEAKYTVDENNPVYSSDENGVLFNKDKTELIKYSYKIPNEQYVMPDSVNTIAHNAFYRCTKIKTLNLSDGITTIQGNTFTYCSFDSVTIPDTVTVLESDAFSNCSFSELYIGKGVKKIYSSNSIAPAFYNIRSLKTITVSPDNPFFCNDENGVLYTKDMKSLLLYPQGSTIEDFTVPSSVVIIASPFGTIEAGGAITSLKVLNISENVKEISSNFKYVTSLEKINVSENNYYYSSNEHGMLFDKNKTVLVCVPAACNISNYAIPNTVTDIGNAFYSCDKIENVTMSDSVTSWSLEAFSGCQSLKTIKLSSGLINIPTKAFQSCRNLESIIIPNSIISIDGMAFAYCSNLKDVYYTGSQNDWNNTIISEEYNQYLLNADIHYDYGAVTGNCGENASWSFNEITKTLTISGSGKIDEKATFEEYGWYSFKDSIAYVEIIDGITNVPANAFSGCEKLKEVYLGTSVSSVGENAFSGCASLLVFTAHNDSIEIADSAFNGYNEKLTFICPSTSSLASSVPNNAPCITVSFDEENSVLEFNGELTVYNGPKYDFLSVFLNEYSYADYIYFEKIVFDGVDSGIILDFEGADSTAPDLTLTNLYVNLAVVRGDSQENITFEEMLELLENGDYDAFKFVIQSDDMNGEKTFIQKVEDFFAEITENALRAISSVINFIAKLFRKKK